MGQLHSAAFLEQSAHWPLAGRHIMAHYDDRSIIVYQAYNITLARYVLANGQFGGPFSFDRMSWMKPNFLWMMFRSGWGTKPNQEVTIALRLDRKFFDELLARAVPSTYDASLFKSVEDWRAAVATSDVRLQWDPDHHPSGAPLARRAIQLGLRGSVMRCLVPPVLIEVLDLSDLVAAQRKNAVRYQLSSLVMPLEAPYLPEDIVTRQRLRLDESGALGWAPREQGAG